MGNKTTQILGYIMHLHKEKSKEKVTVVHPTKAVTWQVLGKATNVNFPYIYIYIYIYIYNQYCMECVYALYSPSYI